MELNKTNYKKISPVSVNSIGVSNNPDNSFFCPEGVKDCKKTLSPKEVVISLLRAKNWTQVDLANQIGITRQGLNNYICGRWAVPTRIKIKIAQALEVDSSVIWDLEVSK